MVKMTQKEIKFLKWVKDECKKHGIKPVLRNVSYLKLSGNIRCSGYFDGTDRVLAVAMKNPDWIEILVHEYCHLTQWSEGIDLWDKGSMGTSKVDDWLSGERVYNIKKYLGYNRDLELDNEKRSVALIKEWNLDVDIDMYVKKANAYIQFYNYLYYSRRWSKPGNSPYVNKKIIEAMPTKFSLKYSNISKRLYNLFKSENI